MYWNPAKAKTGDNVNLAAAEKKHIVCVNNHTDKQG